MGKKQIESPKGNPAQGAIFRDYLRGHLKKMGRTVEWLTTEIGLTKSSGTAWFKTAQMSRETAFAIASKIQRPASEVFAALGMVEARNNAVVVRTGDDTINIPQLAVSGAMGAGTYPPDHIDVVQMVSARISDLRKQCSFSDPKKLQIITGCGGSMEPTFNDGDPLLVDTAINVIDLDAVYVFTFKGETFIKGVQRVPGEGLLVISHNERVAKPWPIKQKDYAAHLLVHGRVILAWNARRF